MFWNLWKYEIKCSYRSYALMYGILLLSSLLMNLNDGFMNALISLTYGVMIIVTLVMTIVLVIRNYNQSMFQRPGYLTMTLPVSSKMIMLVKILNASLWFILSYFVVIISAIIIGSRFSGASIADVFNVFGYAFNEAGYGIFLVITNLTLSLISAVALIYAILNFTHSCYVRKHRVIIAIGIYVVFNILWSFIGDVVFNGALGQNGMSIFFSSGVGSSTNYSVESMMWVTIAQSIVVILVCYFSASYLLDHKLEME